ncbi:signal peptidase II [Mariprofundus erugo]|uniref:Lipoprotein signal peptidase n=1 Tax=Mariprofundus erugo TaxID=2528639 RepID=A0A5R9GTY1_9PROT|nr:signal peptidase II [Mariprofundus erugo]TLS68319.1 signal peptidase II [Mariprofundus erugo]TLS73674.1 signal peptidase II [Mariprofundus erugo]
MNRSTLQAATLVLLVAADQLSKWWIQQTDFHPFIVIDGFFNIIRAYNPGVAFSMFADLPDAVRIWLLLAVTITIAIAVVAWWWKERLQDGITSWLLVMILAGAIGNIWDRIQLGYVVDFIDWYIRIGGNEYHWPAFNIADSCISVAVVLLLVTGFKKAD